MPGQINQGVGIDQDDDLVYVPDQPDFTFANGVTVAAWVKPTKLNGVRTIFRKRESGTSTFVLLDQRQELSVRHPARQRSRGGGQRCRLRWATFTHVAGTYDGSDLRLYLNGALATHARVGGVLSNGAGPLLMGNDALDRRIDGTLDSVFFATRASTRRRDRAPRLHSASVDAGRHADVERVWSQPGTAVHLRPGADQQQLRSPGSSSYSRIDPSRRT